MISKSLSALSSFPIWFCLLASGGYILSVCFLVIIYFLSLLRSHLFKQCALLTSSLLVFKLFTSILPITCHFTLLLLSSCCGRRRRSLASTVFTCSEQKKTKEVQKIKLEIGRKKIDL